jgi:hypothetical protein
LRELSLQELESFPLGKLLVEKALLKLFPLGKEGLFRSFPTGTSLTRDHRAQEERGSLRETLEAFPTGKPSRDLYSQPLEERQIRQLSFLYNQRCEAEAPFIIYVNY